MHDNYVGAVQCSSCAHRVCKGGPTLYTGVIGISANIGHRPDKHAIAVNIDSIRCRPAPEEIHYGNAFVFKAGGSQRDLTRPRVNVRVIADGRFLVAAMILSRLAGREPGLGFLHQFVRPIGVSFWTLQALSYLFDIYREEELDPSLLEFCLYMAFWPTVLAGPICRLSSLLPQFRRPISPNRRGCRRWTR